MRIEFEKTKLIKLFVHVQFIAAQYLNNKREKSNKAAFTRTIVLRSAKGSLEPHVYMSQSKVSSASELETGSTTNSSILKFLISRRNVSVAAQS